MIRGYVKLHTSTRPSQCCARALQTVAQASRTRRKKTQPEVDKNVTESRALNRKRRALGEVKDDEAPMVDGDAGRANENSVDMGARISKAAAALSRTRTLPTKSIRTKAVPISARQLKTVRASLPTSIPKHHDLASFLEDAERSGKDPNSNFHKGTRYEYVVVETLKRHGMDLERIGRAGDRGKDFEGTWKLPRDIKKRPNDVFVVGQCKARNIGPKEVRELAGTSSARDCLRVLASTLHASDGTIKELQDMNVPMVLLHITEAGVLVRVNWNEAASQRWLARLGAKPRYGGGGDHLDGNDDAGPETIIVLTWDGKSWLPKPQKSIKAATRKRKVIMPKRATRKAEKGLSVSPTRQLQATEVTV